MYLILKHNFYWNEIYKYVLSSQVFKNFQCGNCHLHGLYMLTQTFDEHKIGIRDHSKDYKINLATKMKILALTYIYDCIDYPEPK